MSAFDALLSEFLTKEELAAELRRSPRTLDRWERLGEGPPITKLGRRVLYRRSSLQVWLRAREQGYAGERDAAAASVPKANGRRSTSLPFPGTCK